MSQILGRETRIVRRELTDSDIEAARRRILLLQEEKRGHETKFTAFRRWAEPRLRRARDPEFQCSELDGTEPLDPAAVHGLRVELQRKRRLKTSACAAIVAEMDALEAHAASGCEYRVVECEKVSDPDKLEVIFLDGDVEVDRRGMTDAERQETLPNIDPPKKGKSKRNGAPEAVQ